jgi:hypothetical protein
VLGGLGLLEGRVVGEEPSARVGHARAEDQPVELVAHVVVVADDRGVPRRRVELAGRSALLGRGGKRQPDGAQAKGRIDDGGQGPQSHLAELAPRGVVQHTQQGEDVSFDGEVPGDEGPGHAQLAGRPQDPAHGVGRSDPQRPDPVGRPYGAPVPELETDRGAGPDESAYQRSQGGGDAALRWGVLRAGLHAHRRRLGNPTPRPAGGLSCGRLLGDLGDHG